MLKWLISLAVVVVVMGIAWPRLARRLPLGRLPGDVTVRLRGRDYLFPFTTTVLASALMALIFALL